MNWIDIVLGILLLLGLWKGLSNGFFVEVASLLGLILGIYCAIHFSNLAADWLSTQVAWDETVINLAAFAITFLVVVIAIGFAGKALSKIASLAMLGIFNKVLGAVFGIVKVAFIVSVVLLFVNSAAGEFNILNQEEKDDSILYGYVEPIGPFLLPKLLQGAKDLNLLDQDEEVLPEGN